MTPFRPTYRSTPTFVSGTPHPYPFEPEHLNCRATATLDAMAKHASRGLVPSRGIITRVHGGGGENKQ
eukprot:765802-Hanusia_phi.AAC.3